MAEGMGWGEEVLFHHKENEQPGSKKWKGREGEDEGVCEVVECMPLCAKRKRRKRKA